MLVTALLTSAAAAICFIAPVASYRILFRQGRKEGVVWVAHAMSIVGLVLLVVAMALAVWLVVAKLWSATPATWIAVGVIVLTGLLWVVVPL